MKILVTGGNGFIGARLLRALSAEPSNELFSLVHRRTEAHKGEKNGAAHVMHGSVNDPDLDASPYDMVYHLAAVSDPKKCEADRASAWRTNVDGTRNVVEKMRRGARIVFLSSAHVYGPGAVPHSENEAPEPQTFYGLTKLAGEGIADYYCRSAGLGKTVFRLFNTYSVDQPPGFLVPDVMAKYSGAGAKEVEILNPDSELDLVHVEDAVAVLAAASKMEMNGTYNICTGKPVKISEVYSRIKSYVGAKGVAEKRSGTAARRTLGNNSKISALGFKFRPFSLP